MTFNDTTTQDGLIQSCEFWTGKGNAQISGDSVALAEFTRLINVNYNKVVTMILASMDEWDFDDINNADAGFIKTYNTTSGTQTITLPASDKILKIKRAEITYDGTNWVRLAPIDINEYGGTSDTATIAANFSQSTPYYDVHGNYVYLYPIPTASVTGGLKLWITREVDAFTVSDTTQAPGIDKPFHDMIAVGASLDYAFAHGLASTNGLAAKFVDYENRIKQYYGSRQEDRAIVMKPSDVFYE
tara:strand:+ start:45 stop:776 length:732 start_codon:yes stop_codon:yes gene_type:complete